MKDIITPKQRENLEKLATYLESGSLKAEFDMSHYTNRGYWDEATDCGTAGCAVGHGPFAGIEKWPMESWSDYCHRVFIREVTMKQGLFWSFLFSAGWSETKFNQAIHAAKRIRHFLNGLPINLEAVIKIVEYSKTPECENIHK